MSLAPFIVSGIFANILGLRYLLVDRKVSLSVRVYLEKILACSDCGEIEISFIGKRGQLDCGKKRLTLPASYEDSKDAQHHARASIDLGLLLLREQHPAPVDWRLKMVKLGNLLPLFTIMVVIFSCLLGKLLPTIGVAAITFSLGLSSVLLWLSIAVEKEAAHLMVDRVEKLRIIPRLSEEEALVTSIRAVPWARLIPGALLKLILKD